VSNRNSTTGKRTQPLPGLKLPNTLPQRKTTPPPSPNKRKALPRFGERDTDKRDNSRAANRQGERRPPPPTERNRPPLPPLRQTQNNRRKEARRRPVRRRSMPPRLKSFLNKGLAFIIMGGLVIMLGLRFFSYNALAVYLDNLHVGYIILHRETTSESFHNDVISHLEATYMTDVVVSQRVTVSPARRVANRNINRDRGSMISLLGREMNVQVVARAIYVNNQFEVIVRSEDCVTNIENTIKNGWRTDDTIEAVFTVHWDARPYNINADDDRIWHWQDAMHHLDRRVTAYHRHVVLEGENLTVIARLYGTTAADIANLNNRTLAQQLNVGEILTVRTLRPLLSVQTVDETVIYQRVEIPVEVRYSPYLAISTREIIQEGVPGEQRIAQRITRINDMIISTETLEAVITLEPIPEIVEEGTRPAVIERR